MKKDFIFKSWTRMAMALLLAASLCAMAGCTNSEGDRKKAVGTEESGGSQAEGADEGQAADADAQEGSAEPEGDEDTEGSADTESGADTGDGADAADSAGQKEGAQIEEQVLVDQDGIKITAKSLEEDGLMGPELALSIENNAEQNITVQARNASINGIMVETVFSCDVAAGKTANDEITFLKSELEDAGIEAIQNFEFNFHVFLTEGWDTVFDSDTIYLPTSLDGTAEQAVDDSGVLLLDQDGIKITVKEADNEGSFWGADIYIYVENNTEQNVTVQADSVSINGFMVEPFFSCDVVAGKKAYDTITFLESDLEKNNIQSIDDMEVSFRVFQTDSFDTIFETEPLAVKFEE